MDRALDEAAGWHARMSAGDCCAQEKNDFERWLGASEAHARAYARVRGVAAALDELGGADARLQALAEQAYRDAGREPRVRHRRRMFLAMAASVVAVVGLAVLLRQERPQDVDLVRYEAPPYERRDINLADGSLVRLDADSILTARLSGGERRIDMLKGRAVFDVYHDAAHPFVVHSGGARVTALGTIFEVSRTSSEIVVTLEQGSVLVAEEEQATGQGERLAPGEQIRIPSGAAPVSWTRLNVDAGQVTNWSRGRLIFRNAPLREVLAELNRYSPKKIRVGNSSLDSVPVSGSFVTGNSDIVAPALAAVLPVDAVDHGNEFILIERRR
ncbi:FecR family protein [Solimonas flava]|uniref:FecR family protein n=1 Tax=Solimonas flava TaxID=415849 RepID=UPI0013771761|nr:FecR domain-containing protein [Solimonas flava]